MEQKALYATKSTYSYHLHFVADDLCRLRRIHLVVYQYCDIKISLGFAYSLYACSKTGIRADLEIYERLDSVK